MDNYCVQNIYLTSVLMFGLKYFHLLEVQWLRSSFYFSLIEIENTCELRWVPVYLISLGP